MNGDKFQTAFQSNVQNLPRLLASPTRETKPPQQISGFREDHRRGRATARAKVGVFGEKVALAKVQPVPAFATYLY